MDKDSVPRPERGGARDWVQAEARQTRALLADTPRPPSREKPALCIFLVKLFLKEVAGLRSRQPHQAAGHHEPRRDRGSPCRCPWGCLGL